MKGLLKFLKSGDFNVPMWLGAPLSKIPFDMRPGIGKNYKIQKEEIIKNSAYTIEDQKRYIFEQFHKVFEHAFLNIPFYAELYKSKGLTLQDISDFDSISKVPIINKNDLINVPIEERSYPINGRFIVNTGGSSGKTLSFYSDPRRFGNEWAHIHHMWAKLGYRQDSLKLSFDGRSKVKNYVQYDFLRHSLRFDIYSDKFKACRRLLDLCEDNSITYLHGYPSAIYEFALHCQKNEPKLLEKLRNSLKGAFLSSEYPSPYYRRSIEEIFSIPTQSFYGHTETCVMAIEENKFQYKPYQTYGYAEAVNFELKTHLVGTSYFNFASPLIRYDTEDGIKAINIEQGLLKSFEILDGRVGDFIHDKNGTKIPLTGLIFGRHHKLFDLCEHVQIKEDEMGKATIFYVANGLINEDLNMLFDSTNVEIDFSFKSIEKPILTKAGKLSLLLKDI